MISADIEYINADGIVSITPLFSEHQIGFEMPYTVYHEKNNCVYVTSVGNHIGSDQIRKKIVAFDFNNMTVKAKNIEQYFASKRPALFMHNDDLYLFGGLQPEVINGSTNTLFKCPGEYLQGQWENVSDHGNQVLRLTPVELKATYEAFQEIWGHRVHPIPSKNIIVGYGGVMKELHDTRPKPQQSGYVFILDMNEMSFTKIFPKGIEESYIPQSRSYHSSVLYNDRYLFVYGGLSKLSEDKIFVFDLTQRMWIEPIHITIPDKTLKDSSLALVNDYLVLLGGIESTCKFATLHLPTGVWKFYTFSPQETSILNMQYESTVVLKNNALFVCAYYAKKSQFLEIKCADFNTPFTGAYFKDTCIAKERKDCPYLFETKSDVPKDAFVDLDCGIEDEDIFRGLFE